MTLLERLREDPRARIRNRGIIDPGGRTVVYWMQRAQRARDNPALETAAQAANELGKPLTIFFSLVPDFPGACEHHYRFMLEGLVETVKDLERLGARFVLGVPPENDVVRFCAKNRPVLVIGDENPLRVPEEWRRTLATKLKVAFVTIDADVVVPTSFFPKEEFAARTIRPKIHRILGDFLVSGRRIRLRHRAPDRRSSSRSPDAEALLSTLGSPPSAGVIKGPRGGRKAALKRLRGFSSSPLADYHLHRNHPEIAEGTSLLSPYLHFGQLGAREIALAVMGSEVTEEAREAFLEELIVRRELCINYVLRNPDYDRFDGLNDWARKTLEEHVCNARPYRYSERALENAETHDPLWNAAQTEMVRTGRTHGYARMYWAKKILQWAEHPSAAMEIAIRLNDKYFLDGRDPNGYANIAWAVGGKHDRPWPERPVFGKIRSMTYRSTSKKFDCRAYIERVNQL